jgi:cardiolipin synthase
MLESILYTSAAIAGGALMIGSAGHALLTKRDPRSQLGWVVLCLFFPPFGVIGYWLLGVNRIRTRARRWQEEGRFELRAAPQLHKAAAKLANHHPEMADSLRALLKTSQRVTGRPLLGGNHVEPLFNGEETFPAMIEAIDRAERYVYLCTYIFDTDAAGLAVIDALTRAAERGVDVRVLVDAVGERYARPRASRVLRRRGGIKVARFLPLALSLRGLRVNLRNHRKLLVCDGSVGFTGGMNIGQRHMVEDEGNRKKTADIHFRVSGPAVYELEEVFVEDWRFTTGREEWQPFRAANPVGEALCRGIKDGPNEDFERFQWIVVGALACARTSVKVMTPYFIPTREVISALCAAALRGVNVEILLPRESNLPFVGWATQAMLPEVMRHGVRVYYQPAPFNHAKLFIVDDFYVNVGSANWDPRSFRLNFELNLEVYSPELGREMGDYFEEVRRRSIEISLEWLEQRTFPTKLRDAFSKLFAPYL